MTDEEAIRLGAVAGTELDLSSRAFEELKAAIIQEIIETAWEHSAKRERLYVALKTLGMVRAALENAVQAGKTARAVVNYRDTLAASGLTKP